MPTTTVRGTQITNATIQRQDLDTSTVGQAVVAKIVQGSGIALSSTGGDSGTGDVTVSVSSPLIDALPVGTVILYVAGGTPPASWMACDGSAVSRTTYPDLFTAIGTTYGAGDGSTTFNLPDLRGRTAVGVGQGTGFTNRVLAAKGGEETHQLTIAELAAHSHTDSGHSHNLRIQQSGTSGSTAFIPFTGAASTEATDSGSANIQNTGSGTAHNTMQPFLVLNYIIRVSVSGGATAQAPIADTTQSGLMRTVSGNTTDFIDGTNNSQPLQPVIWSVRLRSYNALQNSAFEVDQVNVGNTISITAGIKVIDRWNSAKVGTMATSAGQNNAAAGDVCIPGTSFRLTRNFFRVTLTTQQSSLGTGDSIQIYSLLEGPRFRELQYDVHSVSLLVRSSVAGLVFACSLRDPPTTTQSLIKLCTIPTANVWTLIQLANLPVWPSSGNFAAAPGVLGYQFGINLAVGSTLIAPANTWQSGNFLGASGMSNFAASPVSSTFDIAYAGHQPGAFCETPIDCPFQQAYDEALRYYCKSYDYDVALGTAAGNSPLSLMQTSTTAFVGPIRFPKAMAKIPTLTAYSGSTGAINTIRLTGGIDYSVTGFNSAGKGGFFGINTATLPAVTLGATGYVHYAGDTGW